MVRFGSGTIELERIRPRRIPRHFFWHELELPGDAGGKKRKRKKARGSGGEGTRWDEVKGRPAIHHHAWSPALTTARYRCVFLPKLHFATFSNPHAEIVPNFSIDPQSHSRSKIGTREMGRDEWTDGSCLSCSTCDSFVSTYIFLLTDRYTDTAPSRGHSFPRKRSTSLHIY